MAASCSICLLDIYDQEDDDSTSTCALRPCGHRFHSGCIQKWLADPVRDPTCPVCRVPTTGCQHGALGDHDTPVLMDVIAMQRRLLRQNKKSEQEMQDQMHAMQTQIDFLWSALRSGAAGFVFGFVDAFAEVDSP